MPTFNQLSQLTENLGFAIAIATFLVFMLAVLVVWQMRDLRDMQNRHANERDNAARQHAAERESADQRHASEREAADRRHCDERAEWRQTQAALLARFAEAQERNSIELIGELKQQTRLLERLDERTHPTASPIGDGITPRTRRQPATKKETTNHEN